MSKEIIFLCIGFMVGWFWSLLLIVVLNEKKESRNEMDRQNAIAQSWQDAQQKLAEAQAEIERLKERQEFAPDQWWIKDLSCIDSASRNLTHDEYRAVRIAVTAINVLMFDNAASKAREQVLREALNVAADKFHDYAEYHSMK